MNQKKRLDDAAYERGLTSSAKKAQALIMAGIVYLNGNKQTKAGFQVKDSDLIEIRGTRNPFVSRGGLKLQKAIKSFEIILDAAVCLDVGASTGGFTDCMLHYGAAKVYAVDSGYNQLAWKLRTDDRVVNLERTNFRFVTKELILDPIDFASVDVAFISLRLILPVLLPLLKNGARAVCLIKPQFEADRENVGEKGVVRDASVHTEVVEAIGDFAVDNGYSILNIDYSPLKGPEGNIEYLMHLIKSDTPQNLSEISAEELVKLSHAQLNGGDVS
ncbi:MAG TPA: TlyA family RNA methyltransferase [Clostridia bacterium]|nr:TlyA family RNA methyltransferase [Clostridia bacterium]